MTNLKQLDSEIISGFEFSEELVIRTGSYRYKMTPNEVLGVINQLNSLASQLSYELIVNNIKQQTLKDNK